MAQEYNYQYSNQAISAFLSGIERVGNQGIVLNFWASNFVLLLLDIVCKKLNVLVIFFSYFSYFSQDRNSGRP